MRDELIALAQRQVLEQACGHPFHLLPIELAQQTTGAGTVFLRWRRHDRSAMGVALWREPLISRLPVRTPAATRHPRTSHSIP